MTNNNSILNLVNKVIYNDPFAELNDDDISLLNSFPVHEIASILRDLFHVEKDLIVKSKIYVAILALKSLDKVQFLLDIFDQSSSSWQTAYCRSLSKFKEPRVVTKLCAVLRESKDSNTRYVVAELLAEIGDATAIPFLEYAEKYDSGEDYEGFPVAEMAHEALMKIKERVG